jgi:hypothetical protein
VSGLAGGESIVLNYHSTPANAATKSVTISANGAYGISDGTYAQTITAKNIREGTPSTHLRIATHPDNKYCIFTGLNYSATASGTLTTNLTNFNITCMPKKYVFMANFSGSISGGGITGIKVGIKNADGLCSTQANALTWTSGIPSVKAFIFQPGVRQACNNTTSCIGVNDASRIDFPLQPNTIYVGKGGSASGEHALFHTDANGYFFHTTHMHNLASALIMSFSYSWYWSGFSNDNWSVEGTEHTCGSWTGGGNGSKGKLDDPTSTNLFRSGGVSNDCTSYAGTFLCVSQ